MYIHNFKKVTNVSTIFFKEIKPLLESFPMHYLTFKSFIQMLYFPFNE